MPHYEKPNALTSHIFNPIIGFLSGTLGLSLRGAQVLSVRGRNSGEWRSTPVNPLSFDGQRYLVAPRGETQWARNLRASKEGKLTLGRKDEAIHVTEVPDAEKPPLLRAYLQRWAAETKANFGVGASASEEELQRIAPEHPVFRIEG